MKVILFGASGMIGQGVLLECFDHPEVESILAVGRSSLDLRHSKLKQLEHRDFNDFSSIRDQLKGYDACFFCLGVSAGGMKATDYQKVTYDFTLAAAKILYRINPSMTFTYVSGQGTDSTEKGRIRWARVKGKTENDLLALGFRNAVMFRPGAIIPLRGIRSKTRSYQLMYDYLGWLLKLIRRIWPDSATDTGKLGRAMINAHLKIPQKKILSTSDINALAKL
jgi:uncharacterized protein YbjT (DUF2867 family)